MNAQQYADYQKRVAEFLHEHNIKPGCYGPKDCDAEPYFSWSPCPCCGSSLGGNRELYTFAVIHGGTVSAAICTDCVYYLTYGRLDDSTMLEVERNA